MAADKITNKETFATVGKIAVAARLPLGTVRKHLVTLAERGWIANAGRERTRWGAPRRTCTLRITAKTLDALNDYGVLPWWACANVKKSGMLPWSAKAVLSIIMARLMACKKIVVEMNGDDEDLIGHVENLGDRFRFSLDRLTRETGLSRESVVSAKGRLHRLGIVNWYRNRRDNGGDDTDVLDPRDSFRVVVTPAGEGRCHVAFERGSDSE